MDYFDDPMKKTLSILTFCLLSSLCFGSIALVQSNHAGSNSGSVGPGGTLTATGGFTNNTVTGHLIVLIFYAKVSPSSVSIGNSGLTSVSGGYSGTIVPCLGAASTAGGITTLSQIRFLDNAPAMSTSQLPSVTVSNPSGTDSGTFDVEFELYEFSGIANPLVAEMDPDADLSGIEVSGSGGTTPSATVTTTLNTNLILMTMTAPAGSAVTAGSGFTLGIAASSAQNGQFQYRMNAPPGISSVSFGSSETVAWDLTGIAFKAAPAAPMIARHRGSLF